MAGCRLVNVPAHSYWFNRFTVTPAPVNKLVLRDALMPPAKLLDAKAFTELGGRDLDVAFFQRGFAPPVMTAIGSAVGDRPVDATDELFWQFPCRTEGAAWERHMHDKEPTLRDDELHIYLGLPWATWIDYARRDAWSPAGAAKKEFQLQMIGVRISGLRFALAELGVRLRVHTVCQHIYWRDMVTAWHALGVTDAWLSHYPEQGLDDENLGFVAHPWSLYAVNVLDAQRSVGLVVGKDPADKPVLASFVGANGPNYLADCRSRMSALASEPGFELRITNKWHFEEVVYSQQIGKKLQPISDAVDPSVESYNHLLSNSIFSLCPAGTGPNSLRLWESLAVGAVPVLLGPAPALPRGGNLPSIDWAELVVRVADDQMSELPRILRTIPIDRLRRMQKLGMEAHALVSRQRCY